MIRMLTAHTDEIDDPRAACAEVLERLRAAELPENATGILTCHIDYVKNGTVAAICGQLPFDVIGGNTMIGDTPEGGGEFGLSIAVLAGDGVSFSSGVSAPLSHEQEGPIEALYEKVAAGLCGEPVFAVCFAPMLLHVSGDTAVDILGLVSGNLPIFGMIAADYTDDLREPLTIYNGEAYADRLALLLLSGDIRPDFFSAAIPPEKILKQKAIITNSSGNILKEVNNLPAVKYLESLGLAKKGVVEGAHAIPIMLDFEDGSSPIARTIFKSTPEGHVVCGGSMPIGATLGIASIDFDDVVQTASSLMQACLDTGSGCGALVFSCIGRNLALELENMAEVACVRETLMGKIPYLFSYSAGEICPLVAGGACVNRFHNDSIVACVLR